MLAITVISKLRAVDSEPRPFPPSPPAIVSWVVSMIFFFLRAGNTTNYLYYYYYYYQHPPTSFKMAGTLRNNTEPNG